MTQTSSHEIGRDNLISIYRHERQALYNLKLYHVYVRVLITWIGSSALVSWAYYSTIQAVRSFKNSKDYWSLVLAGVLILVAWRFARTLTFFGKQIASMYILPIIGALNPWYANKIGSILLTIMLVMSGFIVPWGYVIWHWYKFGSINFYDHAITAWMLSFLFAQGHILGSISSELMKSDLIDRVIRAIRFGKPNLEKIELPNTRTSKSEGILIAHMSDLHLSGGLQTIEGLRSPDPLFSLILDKHNDTLKAAHCVLISGDITDSGASEEWISFFSRYPIELFKKQYWFLEITILISLVRKFLILVILDTLFEVSEWSGLCLLLRYVQGERAYVVDDQGSIRKLAAYLDERLPEFVEYMSIQHKPDPIILHDSQLDPMVMQIMNVWRLVFPMAIELSNESVLYVLDSNRIASTIMDNAFGAVNQKRETGELSQIDRLRLLHTNRFSAYAPVFTMHHHLVLPLKPKSIKQWIMTAPMVLLDAPVVYEALCDYSPTVIFHGHRHVKYVCSVENKVGVVSAPSTTLGDEYYEEKPSFFQYKVIIEETYKSKKNHKKKPLRRTRLVGCDELKI